VTTSRSPTGGLPGATASAVVLVHHAGTAQLALAAGVLDELEIHLMPVLLSQGRNLLLFASRTNKQLPRLSAFFALRASFRRLFIFKSGWVTPTHARVSTTGLRSIEVDGYRYGHAQDSSHKVRSTLHVREGGDR
jgi:hypothetical protein